MCMQEEKNNYKRLSEEEREEISRGLACGKSMRAIATDLGRSASTISREIKCSMKKTGYRAFSAHLAAKQRASSRKLGQRRLGKEEPLRECVFTYLKQGWSPQMIAAWLKKEYPDDMTLQVSHEAIYQYIYVLPRGSLKKTLIKALRQERAYRYKGRKKSPVEEARGKIANMLSIEERPKEVADRTVPGHWEGDLIMGRYNQSALGTLVERTTRYLLLVPLKNKDAVSVRRAYANALRHLPSTLAKTLTYDQGKEMADHQQFTIDTGIQVYFAHPASPWERGTNENTNGLIRQYFPKGTDFNKVSRYKIKQIERLLNDRPRHVLHYYKPQEVFHQLVAVNS